MKFILVELAHVWHGQQEWNVHAIIKVVHEVIPEVSFDDVHNSVVTLIQINRRQ